MRIEPFTDRWQPAVRAFNERVLAAARDGNFLLPLRPDPTPATGDPIEWVQHVVIDDEDAVRGGFRTVRHCAWLNGSSIGAVNYQSPLSEAVRDGRYALIGMRMLKYVQRQAPYAFVVGMGDVDRPLPRLLAAAGWTIRRVPFQFRVVRAGAVLRELAPLRRRPALALAAGALRTTGLGALGVRLWAAGALPAALAARRFTLERVSRWERWADEVWLQARARCSFAVNRDRAALRLLYPLDDPRYLAFRISDRGQVAGWAVGFDTQMTGNPYFGNLRVGTVLDCLAAPHAERPVAALTTRALARRGADLIITNQSHDAWIDAFRRCAFVSARSNYLLATSGPLTAAIGTGGWSRLHVVRGEGDGRIHL
jgi:hypothetical protein